MLALNRSYIWVLIDKAEKVAYYLYNNNGNDSRGLRPIRNFLENFKSDEIRKRHDRRDVSQTLSGIYRKAVSMVNNRHLPYNDKKMQHALVYILNGWNNLLKYRHKRDCITDNMVAERAHYPFTVSRNSLHFSSVDSVETAMPYYTIVETAKNVLFRY